MSGGKISNRIRFLVLRRDGFRCVYCGRSAADIELHVDHVQAKSKGGENEPGNYVTACMECNLGKSTESVLSFESPEETPEQALAAIARMAGFNNDERFTETIEMCLWLLVKEHDYPKRRELAKSFRDTLLNLPHPRHVN